MNDLKRFFNQQEWGLIQKVLRTKRKYKNGKTIKWITLADEFNIKPLSTTKQRRVRANDIWRRFIKKQIEVKENAQAKILIYDIETSLVRADLWWSGKQYVNGSQVVSEPRIITLAWKWLGEDEVHYLKWNKKQSDKKLMEKFLIHYNKADMVIGYNNDRFDNRWINARALKHGLEVNTFVKSFDIMKQSKRLFRLPSYAMNYLAQMLEVETKLQHSGLDMWKHIQYGSKKQAKKAMKLMIKYNIQDIIVTEQVYLKVRKYMKNPIHMGVLLGEGKATCPICGTDSVKLYKTTVTAAGTIQHIMKCEEDEHTYKISNSEFLKL